MSESQPLPRLARLRFPSSLNAARTIKAHAASPSGLKERNSRPKYRSDIDGLRAISIIAVVGYHVFPDWVPGGFIGVDVFFVISGFLISTIIFGSLADRNFSFVEFYAHRVRRIFPALIAIMVFCLAIGWDVLLPSEFKYLGKHIAASAAFVQNFVLSHESGYFDIASELKPLNHLWSLAIEEQFYAVFPLLLWGAWRLRINLLALVAGICAISFAANIVGIYYNPTAAFFSLGTRAWELMAGALLAGAMLDKASATHLRFPGRWASRAEAVLHSRLQSVWPFGKKAEAAIRALLSAGGFGLIVYAACAFDGRLRYPGSLAVVPVLGAVLLIFSGSSAWVNRFVLSNRVAVFFGVISYPLYLWHWPLLSYLTIIDNAPPHLKERVLVAMLSIGLAWATYRFIELPIRRGTRFRTAATNGLIVAMVAVLVAGLNAKHLYRSYDSQTTKVIQNWNFSGYSGTEGEYIDSVYGWPALGHNDENKILFVGDSHAEQYVNAVAKSLAAQVGKQSHDPAEVMFPPLLGFPDAIPDEALRDRSITTVVFSHFWALDYKSAKVNGAVRCCGKGLNGIIGVGEQHEPITAQQMDEVNGSRVPEMDKLDREWKEIANAWRKAGKKIYFVLDNPFGEELAPQFLVRRSLFRRIEIVLRPLMRQQAIARDEPVRSRVIEIAEETHSTIIDPFNYLCSEALCPALFPDGTPIYKDYDHLSDDAVLNHVHYLDVIFETGIAHGDTSSTQKH